MFVFVFIPLLPLLAFFLLVVGGQKWGEQGHRIAIPAMGISFVLSVGAFVEVLLHGPISLPLYRLFRSGTMVIDLGLYLDQLTVLLLLLVTSVSGVVHVFSSRYMIGDPRYNRFFAVIALFTFSMLMLVMSNNLLMLYVFWEVMGLCSYLLISHAAQRKPAIQAATKAFLVNALADVGLGFGIILTFATFGTLDIQTILSQAGSRQGSTINILGWIGLDLPIHPVTVIPFFLFLGAMGKSAQMPFHVWLPFAMEAPTPVSALIHAATMVNAGPFLLLRLSPLLVLSPPAMMFIAIIGGATALFAGIVSMTQSDIKKSLAYSTISQIGFMIMSCGIGAFVAAVFHLLAHGFLKAFLFLSTGNALQSVQSHHTSRPQHKGRAQPAKSLYVGALLLACLPPFIIFSGPYEGIWVAQGFSMARVVFWVIGLLTVFCTAVYLVRGLSSLFSTGPAMWNYHTGMPFMAFPQILSPLYLAILFIGGGVVVAFLLAMWSELVTFLAPALTASSANEPVEGLAQGNTWWLMLPFGVAVAGWAYAVFGQSFRSTMEPQNSAWMNRLYVMFLNKGYFDEIYEIYVVQPTVRLAHWLWVKIDVGCIDRVVYGTATLSIIFAKWAWQVVDVKGIDRLTVNLGQQSVGVGTWLWRRIDVGGIAETLGKGGRSANAPGHVMEETGPRTLQHHLLVIIFWLVLAIGLLYMLVA